MTTSCANLVMFNSVIPEIRLLISVLAFLVLLGRVAHSVKIPVEFYRCFVVGLSVRW